MPDKFYTLFTVNPDVRIALDQAAYDELKEKFAKTPSSYWFQFDDGGVSRAHITAVLPQTNENKGADIGKYKKKNKRGL